MLTRFKRPIAVVVTVAALVSSQACYAYLPIETPAAARPTDRVRVSLTPEGTTELARFLGPQVAVAEGDVTALNPDGTMIVAVDFVQQTNGIRQPWSGEGVVAFPPSYRSDVRRRTYLRRQSIVAGSALAAAVLATAVIALRAGGADGGPGGGTVQPPP